MGKGKQHQETPQNTDTPIISVNIGTICHPDSSSFKNAQFSLIQTVEKYSTESHTDSDVSPHKNGTS